MTENNKKLWDRALGGIKEEYTDEAADKVEDMISDDINDSELIIYERKEKRKTPVFAIAAAVAAVIGVATLTTIVITNSVFLNPYGSSEVSSIDDSSDKDDTSSHVTNDVNSSEATSSGNSSEITNSSTPSETTSSNNSSQVGIDSFTYRYLDNDTVAITGYSGKEKIIVIPGEIDGKPVTEIAEKAFNEKEIEEVVIPSGVTAIRSKAFYNCKRLEKIDMPDTLREIGSSVFYNCESLVEVKIPEDIEKIEDYTFYGCKDLEKVVLPDGLEIIGLSAFNSCGFKEITLPESVTAIDRWAFAHNEELERIYLPKKVKAESFGVNYSYNDGYSPFLGCLYLEAIEVDPDNRELYSEDGVLYTKGDNRLIAYPEGKKDEEFKIPDGVKAIGKLATKGSLKVGGYVVFEGNGYLKKIILPESLINIDMYAFRKVEWDLYIEFPEGMSDITISDKAFEYCNGIIFLCRENSVAHQYAKEHDLRFEIIE
ncbi:MAG: leucine-rich repeat domain-containing protein [Ruminococcaceae bacterium]|nr:leucine-rich repeat domain-containing protein [Oscillospiraceae bacterium]